MRRLIAALLRPSPRVRSEENALGKLVSRYLGISVIGHHTSSGRPNRASVGPVRGKAVTTVGDEISGTVAAVAS